MKKNTIVTLIILVIVGVLATVWMAAMPRRNSNLDGMACTMEAKQCPDGSYVGRTGPMCEFAECPGGVDVLGPGDNVSWSIYKDTATGMEFNYPTTLPSSSVMSSEWPPAITVTDGKPSCSGLDSQVSAAGSKLSKFIGGSQYCVITTSEGAAGSTYITYMYETMRGAKLVTLSFTLRKVQCMNYDEPERSSCMAEQASFDPDALASQIIESGK